MIKYYRYFRKLLVVFCALFVGAQSALSVEVENLYQVEVGVESQSNKNRWNAVLAGFKEVMVRRSGSEDVLTSHEVQGAYSKVVAYLQRTKYEAVQDKTSGFPFKLIMHFEPRLIDQLIQEAGMPIWGSNRPLTLLWLAIEQDFSRQVIKESEDFKEKIAAINQQAKRRGIPIIFPLMDLEDQLSVTQSDIWGLFTGPVIEASQRYASDSILAGRIRQIGDSWEAKLVYINQGDESRIEILETSIEALYASISNRLAEVLCKKYCVVEQIQTDQLTMQVSNINSFADIKAMQNYLDGLPSIRKIEIDSVSGSHVQLNVSLLGDLESLQEGVRLGQKLIEETPPEVDPFAQISMQTEDAVSDAFDINSQNGDSEEEGSNQAEVGLEVDDRVLGSATTELDGVEVQGNETTDSADTVLKGRIIYYRWQG